MPAPKFFMETEIAIAQTRGSAPVWEDAVDEIRTLPEPGTESHLAHAWNAAHTEARAGDARTIRGELIA